MLKDNERESRLDEVTDKYIAGNASHKELLDAERDYGVDYASAILELARPSRQLRVFLRKLFPYLKVRRRSHEKHDD